MVRSLLQCTYAIIAAAGIEQLNSEQMGLLQQRTRGQVSELLVHTAQAHQKNEPPAWDADLSSVCNDNWCPRTALESMKEDFQTENMTIRSEMEKVRDDIAGVQDKITASKLEKQEYKSQITGVRDQLSAAIADLESLRNDMAASKDSFTVNSTSLKEQIVDLTSKLGSAQKLASDAAAVLSGASSATVGDAALLQSGSGCLNTVERWAVKSFCEATSNFSGMSHGAVTFDGTQGNCEWKLDHWQQLKTERMQKLTTKLENLKSTFATKQTQLADSEESVEKAAEKLDELKRKNNEAGAEILKVTDEFEDMEATQKEQLLSLINTVQKYESISEDFSSKLSEVVNHDVPDVGLLQRKSTWEHTGPDDWQCPWWSAHLLCPSHVFKSMQREYNAEKHTIDGDIAALKANNQALKDLKNEHTEDEAGYQELIEDAQMTLASTMADLDALDEHITTSTQQHDLQVAEWNSALKDLADKLGTVQSLASEAAAALHVDASESSLLQLRDDWDWVWDIEEQHEQWKKNMQVARAKVAKLRKEKESLTNQLAALDGKKLTLDDTLSDIEEQESNLEDLNAYFQALTANQTAYITEKRELAEKLEAMVSDFSAKVNEVADRKSVV